ncbi:MAG TPA: hypothetical protein VIF15_01480 [Polyangiaceae bacterium]
MTARPRIPWSFVVAAAVLGGTVAALHAIRLVEPLGVDQGLFACFTRWVPRGWLPYRDIFDSKPPLFLYSYALAALVPGADVARAIGWMDGAFLLGSLSVAYVVGARIGSRWLGLAFAAALFVGLWSPAWGGFWSRAQAEELLAAPMIGSAWFAWRSIDRHPLATLAGVLAGVCGLYKIPAMAIAGAWMVTWLLTVPRAGALRRIALLACGMAVPWLVATIWFAAHRAQGDFFTGVFVYHRYNAAFIAPPWLDVLGDFGSAMLTRAPLLLLAAAVGLTVMAERRARELRWVAPWIGFTLAAVVLQRQLADYHYLLAIPALSFAAGYGVVALVERVQQAAGRPRVIAAACLVALAGLFAREASQWALAYGPDAMVATGRLPRDVYLRRIQQGSYSTATEEAAARYVRDHTSPSDGILVWGLSPGIYAIADRHPVTRYPFHKILMTDAPLSRMWPGLEERRAELMERLRADPPVYVLVGRGDVNGFEPMDSMGSMMRFPPLRAMLEREYQPETTLGHFVVLRRTAGGGERTSSISLDSVPLDEAAIDWTRPIPVTPPGGVAAAGYVGASACEPCHTTINASFGHHSMARTGLRPLASLDPKWLASIFDAGSAKPVKHERSGFTYRPFRRGDRYFVEESLRAPDGTVVESWTEPLTHSLSAGSYGMAFYFEQGNRFFQVPIDYYAKLARWDVDAGAAAGGDFRFSKALSSSCISCHGDFPRHLAGSDEVFLQPMPPGVGCERCHGPGEKHVKTTRAEDIVNPSRLTGERQIDVCAQCHESDHFFLRAGHDDFSYRPGQPLSAVQTSFIADPPEPDRFILLAHPERMVASACYRGSKGKLTCTSCHDAHVSSIDEPASWWDGKCNACHQTKPCTETKAARAAVDDHCVTCHMRQGPTSNLALVTVTDHWIQRRPPPIRPGASDRPGRLVAWSSLVGPPVPGSDLGALEAQAWAEAGARDEAMRRVGPAAQARPRVPKFWEWLGRQFDERDDHPRAARAYAEALRIDPDERLALLGYARETAGTAESLRAIDRALVIDGEDGAALEARGIAVFRTGSVDEAKTLFERAAATLPSAAASHVGLAALALRDHERDVAIEHLEAARRVEPGDVWILDRLVETYRAKGDTAQADAVQRAGVALASMGRAPTATDASRWLPPDWR